MTKLLKNLWARFLFQDRGIVPTRRFLVGYAILSLIITLLTLVGLSWTTVILLNVFVLLASLLDLRFTPKRSQLKFRRLISQQLERGLPYKVAIEVRNESDLSCNMKLIDGTPQSFQVDLPLEGEVTGTGTTTLTYDVIAPVRGFYQLKKIYVRYYSAYGLWQKQTAQEIIDEVKVIPDLTETKKYLEDAQHYLMHEGMKIRKRKSGVGEFSQIRNYVVGDDPRKINWRQTAKLQAVMTNELEPEHGKHVMLLIDCGRMMGAELKSANRLERALEASITVAAAALGNGDYVGVIAFSKDVSVFVPPDKGMAQLQKILHAIYDLKVDAVESNYVQALNYLQAVQKKRSLILLFSDMQTFLQEDRTLGYFEGIKRRHLFLLVTIQDELLVKRAKEDPNDVNQAMIKGVAQQQILYKKRQKVKWEKRGFLMVEAKEERLATDAVSHYIQIMNQGLL
ncbi:DUF58 domain-containing protein [Ornithinibacillus sp. BX22]|uniref:DUF58 domain-containing protein n=2 Tax=Ornithinibacillus TaxID=484508 RepID=A0A923L2Y5_9BACI|nr:DUF58 domain-containing protein [Ornithinibacillus massiliensis]MBC5635502.1 DUF58 domain-containing protein [Ornithinibacillus hominis]MBS3679112.1 DUF58 domain-containing protein [Ornithinibacillus massiliensis]